MNAEDSSNTLRAFRTLLTLALDFTVILCMCAWDKLGKEGEEEEDLNFPNARLIHTCILSTGSDNELALWMR
jgi:hypothetical protein